MRPAQFFWILIVVAPLLTAAAQTQPASKPGTAPPLQPRPATAAGLPTEQEIDAALRRNLGYDPSVTWQIYEIRPSAIPDITDVVVSLKGGNPIHIYVSADRHNAIAGELIPFGPNPFAATREKLRAADGPARGAAAPTIDIVVFSDLECPHCKAAEPILNKLVTDFPQVRVIFQQFPLTSSLHPWAMKAALY